MCTTTVASCQFHRTAYFPTICDCMKWIPADWSNRINIAMKWSQGQWGQNMVGRMEKRRQTLSVLGLSRLWKPEEASNWLPVGGHLVWTELMCIQTPFWSTFSLSIHIKCPETYTITADDNLKTMSAAELILYESVYHQLPVWPIEVCVQQSNHIQISSLV